MSPHSISFTPKAILARLGTAGEHELSTVLSEFPTVDLSSLLKQLSLHLPRFEVSQIHKNECVIQEARRLSNRLEDLHRQHVDKVPVGLSEDISLENLHFCRLSDDLTKPILDCFHYILSFRENSTHLGLKLRPSDEWPVIMVSLSPFDLRNIAPALTLSSGQIMPALILSRVFAFPVAPRNAFSFLMSKVRQWLIDAYPEVEVLLTYVNPNIGFSGASYKADNWKLIGEEHGTRYLYLEGNYKTDRFLHSHFRKPIDVLLSSPGFHVSSSKHILQPLKIFMRSISKCKPDVRKYHFKRWSPD